MSRALVVGVAALSMIACPSRAPDGPRGPESGGGGVIAGDDAGDDRGHDRGGDGESRGAATTGADTSDEGVRVGATSAAERPDPAATAGFDETLESMSRDRSGRDKPGLAGAGGCEGGTRAVGERWKVQCNTCTCEASGEVTCTLMACMPIR